MFHSRRPLFYGVCVFNKTFKYLKCKCYDLTNLHVPWLSELNNNNNNNNCELNNCELSELSVLMNRAAGGDLLISSPSEGKTVVHTPAKKSSTDFRLYPFPLRNIYIYIYIYICYNTYIYIYIYTYIYILYSTITLLYCTALLMTLIVIVMLMVIVIVLPQNCYTN